MKAKTIFRMLESAEDDATKADIFHHADAKVYHLKGNSLIHAPGVIRMAQAQWRSRSKKDKQNGLDIIKSWQGLPDDVYLKILNGEIEIRQDGDDAVITILS